MAIPPRNLQFRGFLANYFMNNKKKEPFWRLEKKDGNGNTIYEEIKLSDASVSQLLEWSSLCESILNGDEHHAGKLRRQRKIKSYLEKVTLDNLLRNICEQNKMSKNELYIDISENPFTYADITDKYKMVDIKNACIGKLGIISDRVLPLKYLLSKGCSSHEPIEVSREQLGLSRNDPRLQYSNNGEQPIVLTFSMKCYGCDITEFPKMVFDNLIYAFTQYMFSINMEVNKWKKIKDDIDKEINNR